MIHHGTRIFSYPELLNTTRDGERGEYIVMRVQRMGQTLELSLPRGPLGVRLKTDRIDPDAGS